MTRETLKEWNVYLGNSGAARYGVWAFNENEAFATASRLCGDRGFRLVRVASAAEIELLHKVRAELQYAGQRVDVLKGVRDRNGAPAPV